MFAVPEFRALWSAQALSSAGDQFSQVAIAVVVYARTGSAFLTAVAYSLSYLPPVVGGPLLSGLADLFPRQQLMIMLDLARAGLVALMALAGLPLPALGLLFCRHRDAGRAVLGRPLGPAAQRAAPAHAAGRHRPRQPHRPARPGGRPAGRRGDGSGLRPVPGARLRLPVLQPVGRDRGQLGPAAAGSPTPARGCSAPASWEITGPGLRAVFGSPVLRILVLFGWLAGFAVVPEGLAMPYARSLGGGAATGGLLMAALPAGTVVGGFVLGRLMRPSDRMRPMGWLAMLSCAPLLFALVRPPLPVVLLLWALAGAGAAYQLAAASAFVRALPSGRKVPAFAVAQSGLLAAQGLGILTGGAVAQRMGPQAAITLAGLLGLVAAAALATAWTHRHGAADHGAGRRARGGLGRRPGPHPRPAPPAHPASRERPASRQRSAPGGRSVPRQAGPVRLQQRRGHPARPAGDRQAHPAPFGAPGSARAAGAARPARTGLANRHPSS